MLAVLPIGLVRVPRLIDGYAVIPWGVCVSKTDSVKTEKKNEIMGVGGGVLGWNTLLMLVVLYETT